MTCGCQENFATGEIILTIPKPQNKNWKKD